ncbi:hypothetical protein, partial [Gluconobacter sp. P1D12_c]|uniref:hypothetical protein n=1 Tax=Gluconobacter sp. P1D12_c TaxID=2762614 RepID=UPI001C042181
SRQQPHLEKGAILLLTPRRNPQTFKPVSNAIRLTPYGLIPANALKMFKHINLVPTVATKKLIKTYPRR